MKRFAPKIVVYSVLTLLFAISIVVRIPQVGNGVRSHEQTYILTLQTSEIWRSAGMASCHFTPMWTYGHPGDKFMAYYKRLEDSAGNNYYVSFPPLSFWLAHLALAPFDPAHGRAILQLLNFLLHFISALLLYKLLGILVVHRWKGLSVAGLTAFIVYMFMPVMLYFHTDIFFPEMAGQVMWVLCLYLLLLWHQGGVKRMWLLFTAIFYFAYAEWLAVFFVFTWCVWSFLQRRKQRSYSLKPSFTGLLVLFCAGMVMFVQFASIAGVEELLRAMGLRFLERSGFFGETYSSMGVHIFSMESLMLFGSNLHKALFPLGYVIVFIFVLTIRKIKWASGVGLVLVLAVVPVFLHWLVFFNANALHLLLMGRIAVPLSIVAGLLAGVVLSAPGMSVFLKERDHLLKGTVILVLVLFIGVGSAIFVTRFTTPESYPELKGLAETISAEASDSASVFIMCPEDIPEPEKYVTYISKRNVIKVNNINEIEGALRLQNVNGYVQVFKMQTDGNVICNNYFIK